MDDTSKKSAQDRYHDKLARMTLRISKDDMRTLDDAATLAGQSRTAYIMQAIRERMERDDAPAGRL